MQLEAIRLTCPNFDPENFQQGRYTMNESRLINQIACTYLDAGQGKRAIDIYRQLLGYVGAKPSRSSRLIVRRRDGSCWLFSIRESVEMHRARLEPCSIDERLAMQLEAIRLTCPNFDPEINTARL